MLNTMTEPQFGGSAEARRLLRPRPPGLSAALAPYPPPGQYPAAYMDPAAPYGRHPLTGEPLSDKSKVVAGLLQLLGLLGLVGIGRIYLGYTGLGIAQLVVGLITCGIGAVVWGIIDAVLMLTDKVRDPEGVHCAMAPSATHSGHGCTAHSARARCWWAASPTSVSAIRTARTSCFRPARSRR